MNNDRKHNSGIMTLLPLVFLIFLSYQVQPSGYASEPGKEDKIYEIYVIQEFWHTGIVFSTRDVNPDRWPEIENYRHRNFVDVGWGDEKFYQATGNPVFLAARAILWPTQSVLQVFAFDTPVRSAYGSDSRILKIPLNHEQFGTLCSFVSDSYMLDKNDNPVPSTVYGEADHYFLATRKYHLFRTCNTWVAIAFRQAGLDVRSFFILNANQLFRQLSSLPGAEFVE